VIEIAHGSFRTKQPPGIRGTGYVIECLEAALWAFHDAPSFADGALAAVNLGNDADTTGAVYGQLAGAYFGIAGVPCDWLGALVHRELLEGFARRLFAARLRPAPMTSSAPD
jgi:ADP-ribosylglycohydrolase